MKSAHKCPEDIRNLLSKCLVGVLGQRVIDFWPVFALRKPDIIVTCEGGDDASAMAPGVLHISPEPVLFRRKHWTNGSLSELATSARGNLDQLLASPSHPLLFLAYCGTPEWEDVSQKMGGVIRLISPPSAIKLRLDDKIYARKELAARGLIVPQSIVASSPAELQFDIAASRLGLPFILQRPIGSAGIGTYRISSSADLIDVVDILPKDPIIASAYAGGMTLNVHGLAVSKRIEVSEPSVQLTGIAELVSAPFGYCGNDFGLVNFVSPDVVERSKELTRMVGHWLTDEGYVGLYGVDLAVQNNTVSILEVNPRLQGSTWLLAAQEARCDVLPLVVRHFVHLISGDAVDGYKSPKPYGAQAIVHSVASGAQRVSHSFVTGVYELDNQEILRYRGAPSWPPRLRRREILLFGLPPRIGVTIDSGAVLARFACGELIAMEEGRALTEFGLAVVRSVRSGFSYD